MMKKIKSNYIMSSACDYIMFCLFGYEMEKVRERRAYKEISDLIDREYPYMSEQDQLIYKSQLFQKKMLMSKHTIR